MPKGYLRPSKLLFCNRKDISKEQHPSQWHWSMSIQLSSSRPILILLYLTACVAAQEVAQVTSTEKLIEGLVIDSQKHAKPRTERPKRDAIRLAEFCSDLLADDVPGYTARLGDVVAANLKAGRMDDALLLSEKMRQLGDESGFTHLMLFHARAGRKAETAAQIPGIEKSLPRLSLVRRRNAERDLAITKGLMAEKTANPDDLKDLEADIRLEVETEWLRLGKLAAPPLTLDAVKARIFKEAAGPLASVRFAIVALEKALPTLSEDLAKPFIDFIGPLCTETHHPGAHHSLLDLARILWPNPKLRPEASKAMTRYLGQTASYPEQAEWKGPYFADAVPVLLEWGEKELASKAAKDSRAKLEKVFAADVSRALVAAARAAHQVGMTSERDQMLVDALSSARRYPHPRVAADAGVECCLFYSELELPIGDKVYQQIAAILHLDEAVSK